MIQGFSQIYSIDYYKTFALTVRIDTLWIVLALVIIEDYEYYFININNIFIESALKEAIYLLPPYSIKVIREKALRVLYSLYRLK